jgi:hypothetical protein
MVNLIDLYKQLKQPTDSSSESGVRFSACPIPGYENHRLAKDASNYPCLLISTQDSVRNRPAPVKLEHLQVLYDIDCRILHNDVLEENRFTVISCTEQDPLMQEYFLRTSSTIVSVIGNTPTHAQVAKAVDNLVELFRVITESPRKSVQGLWAELLLMAFASNPVELIKAWHKSPDDKYDFSSGSQRVEVKSSTSKLRQHHFSLEQLKPSGGIDVLIASVFVERVGAGTSLAELADKIRAKLNKEPELLLYLDQIIGITLGNKWRSAIDDRFDLQLAKKSLSFFASEAIPSIDPKLPKAISDVHFKVDLTSIPAIDKKLLKQKTGLFKAASPK